MVFIYTWGLLGSGGVINRLRAQARKSKYVVKLKADNSSAAYLLSVHSNIFSSSLVSSCVFCQALHFTHFISAERRMRQSKNDSRMLLVELGCIKYI